MNRQTQLKLLKIMRMAGISIIAVSVAVSLITHRQIIAANMIQLLTIGIVVFMVSSMFRPKKSPFDDEERINFR